MQTFEYVLAAMDIDTQADTQRHATTRNDTQRHALNAPDCAVKHSYYAMGIVQSIIYRHNNNKALVDNATREHSDKCWLG